MTTIETIDAVTDATVREVSALLPTIVRDMFGEEATYAGLDKVQKRRVNLEASLMVCEKTKHLLGEA